MTYRETIEDQNVISLCNGGLPVAVDKISSSLINLHQALCRDERAGRRDALWDLSPRRGTPLGQEAACLECLLRVLPKFMAQGHWNGS